MPRGRIRMEETPLGREIERHRDEAFLAAVRSLLDEGRSLREIGKTLGKSEQTVRNWLGRLGVKIRTATTIEFPGEPR